MQGVAQWAPFKGIEGVRQLAQQLMRRGNAPKALVTQAGAAICGFALWAAKDPEVVQCAADVLVVLEQSGLDLSAALGLAVFNAVLAVTDSSASGDRRDDR